MINQQEHILLCLSSSTSNPDVIKMAAAVAHENKAIFTALYVETPDNSKISKDDRERLQYNTNLARKLGANIETAFGLDIAYQINEFCKNAKVTKVFFGHSQKDRKHLFSSRLDKKLLNLLKDLDINIVYHQNTGKDKSKQRDFNFVVKGKDLAISIFILLIATLIGILFHHLGFSEANTITV